MSTHTPWPWVHHAHSDGRCSIHSVHTPKPSTRLTRRLDDKGMFGEPDARLMAAAPEMLAELEGSLRIVEAQIGLAGSVPLIALEAWSERLRAVIAKASGEPTPPRGEQEGGA